MRFVHALHRFRWPRRHSALRRHWVLMLAELFDLLQERGRANADRTAIWRHHRADYLRTSYGELAAEELGDG